MRFYFDIHENADVFRDDAGFEFATFEDALGEARRTLASECLEAIPAGRPRVLIEVRDEGGDVVATLLATIQTSLARPVRPRS